MPRPPFDTRVLREALRERYPWLDRDDLGPRAVEAGECDRCGEEARLVPTCGPSRFGALGRRCALEVGTDAWCAGHGSEGDAALRWLAALPDEVDAVARLWWIATGEVQLDPDVLERSGGLAELVAEVLVDADRIDLP